MRLAGVECKQTSASDAEFVLRPAVAADTPVVLQLLTEAARWVEQLDGTVMWVEGELDEDAARAEAEAGMFVLAESGGTAVGTLRFQLEDRLFWPDLDASESAFVHRLAV